MEFNVVLADLMMFIRDYDDLSKPRPISKGLGNLFDDLYVKPEPYGLVLIYGAWNYPLSLVAQPLIGAMATGWSVDCIIVKPLTVDTSELWKYGHFSLACVPIVVILYKTTPGIITTARLFPIEVPL